MFTAIARLWDWLKRRPQRLYDRAQRVDLSHIRPRGPALQTSRAIDLSDVPEPSLWSRLFGRARKQAAQDELLGVIDRGQALARTRAQMQADIEAGTMWERVQGHSHMLTFGGGFAPPPPIPVNTVPGGRAIPVAEGEAIIQRILINNQEIMDRTPVTEVDRRLASRLGQAFDEMAEQGALLNPPANPVARIARRAIELDTESKEKTAEETQPMSAGRKVWFDEERPSVTAKRIAKEAREKAERARAEAEAIHMQKVREAQSRAEKAASVTRKLNADKLDTAVGSLGHVIISADTMERMRGGSTVNVQTVVDAHMQGLGLLDAGDHVPAFKAVQDALPVKRHTCVEMTNSVEFDVQHREYTVRTSFTIYPPPAGCSYFLIEEATSHRREEGRPDRVTLSILQPEARRTSVYDVKSVSRSIPSQVVSALPSGLALKLSRHLPGELGTRTKAIVCLPNAGREDLLPYRVNHEVLNDAMRHPNLKNWKATMGRTIDVFGGRAAFDDSDHSSLIVRGIR